MGYVKEIVQFYVSDPMKNFIEGIPNPLPSYLHTTDFVKVCTIFM